MKKWLLAPMVTIGCVSMLATSLPTMAAEKTESSNDTTIAEISSPELENALKTDMMDNNKNRSTSGYVYKYISYSISNRKKTFSHTTTLSSKFAPKVTVVLRGAVVVVEGPVSSASRKFKVYKNTANFKSTWAVYDRYSGKRINTVTYNHNNVSFTSYVAQ